MSLPSKVVVITGANRGLGWEFVNQLLFTPTPPHVLLTKEQFCNNDYTVVALARSIDEQQWTGLQDKLTEFNTTNGSSRKLKPFPCDVSNITQIKSLTEMIKTDLNGRVDIFISNAGTIEPDPATFASSILDFDDETAKIFQVNTIAPVVITNHLAPFLTNAAKTVAKCHGIDLETGVGQFDSTKDPAAAQTVNGDKKTLQYVQCAYVSSNMGSILNTNSPYCPTYRSSKSALNMYIKTLSYNYPSFNFLPMHPGWVATAMGQRGGRNPPVLPCDSIHGMLNIMNTHCHQETSGAEMLGFDGEHIPW